MERTKIAQLFADKERLGGQTVTVSGWARTIRDMKGFGTQRRLLLQEPSDRPGRQRPGQL